MRVTITGEDRDQVVLIEGAKLMWPHLAGHKGKYNAEGERGFTLVFDDEEEAQKLVDAGYNVSIKAPREEGDIPFMKLKVKMAFTPNYQPDIWMTVNGNRRVLNAESCEAIDRLKSTSITDTVVQIHPYDWNNDFGSGRSAWLDGVEVFVKPSRFADPGIYDDDIEI